MLIGVCGSIFPLPHPPLQPDPLLTVPGACAGRRSVAKYLKETLDFSEASITTTLDKPLWDEKAKCFSFPSADALLDHVTKHWRERWVTTSIPTEGVLDMYARRPFFLLVSVDAPVLTRWARHQRKYDDIDTPLEDFVIESDLRLFDPVIGQLPFMSRASVRILNTSSTLADLHTQLAALDLLHPDRLRPSWDMYFMSLASLAAQRSNCMKRRVGCVVVRDRRVISTGYNGTPRGLVNCGEGGCGRCNAGEGSGHGLATCLCIHAEENALLEAGRERLAERAVLYCDTCPCLTCSIKIVQVGIGEVVYSQEYSMDGRTAAVFAEGGVKLRQFVPVSWSFLCPFSRAVATTLRAQGVSKPACAILTLHRASKRADPCRERPSPQVEKRINTTNIKKTDIRRLQAKIVYRQATCQILKTMPKITRTRVAPKPQNTDMY